LSNVHRDITLLTEYASELSRQHSHLIITLEELQKHVGLLVGELKKEEAQDQDAPS
jgi:hypothetical protein